MGHVLRELQVPLTLRPTRWLICVNE
jgi:hypothetical protein